MDMNSQNDCYELSFINYLRQNFLKKKIQKLVYLVLSHQIIDIGKLSPFKYLLYLRNQHLFFELRIIYGDLII